MFGGMPLIDWPWTYRIALDVPLTSAIAACGPIGTKLLYWYLYVADTVFAAPAIAVGTLPVSACQRAGLSVFVSPALRSQVQ